MTIFLIRHGRPTSVKRRSISGRELGRWASDYNERGLDRVFPPPESVSRLVATAGCVVASDLKRSIESATWLAPSADIQVDGTIREAALPDTLWTSVRLPPAFWVVLGRVAWWLNMARSVEDLNATRQRATRAADRLCVLAQRHESVAAVGHGMFNRFIAGQLRARGWHGPSMLSSAYWSCSTFALLGTQQSS
jgi:broad specificity phosphatase PhoE